MQQNKTHPLALHLRYPDLYPWTGQDERRDALFKAAKRVSDENALASWLSHEVHAFIPHRRAVAGVGQTVPGGWRLERKLQVNIARDYFSSGTSIEDSWHSPLVSRWLETSRAQAIDAADIVSPHLFRWRENAVRFGIRIALMDGHEPSLDGRFVFLKLFDPGSNLHEAAERLAEILPALHGAWRNVMQHKQLAPERTSESAVPISFTPKERELLPLIKLGKTNFEIASILGKREATVKTQIAQMLKKSGAQNRIALATSGRLT